MADTSSQAQIVASTKALAGSPEIAGFKDNCTCSQNHIETSALLNDSVLRGALTSFDPNKVKTISDFVRLSDDVKQKQAS